MKKINNIKIDLLSLLDFSLGLLTSLHDLITLEQCFSKSIMIFYTSFKFIWVVLD